jgi:hypothetical protein
MTDEPHILPPEAIPGVTSAGLDQAMRSDREWFATHPGKRSRTRPFIPGEGPPPPPGYEARVRVTQQAPGHRTRAITFHPAGGTANPDSPWAKK